jgi:hypothetical protein
LVHYMESPSNEDSRTSRTFSGAGSLLCAFWIPQAAIFPFNSPAIQQIRLRWISCSKHPIGKVNALDPPDLDHFEKSPLSLFAAIHNPPSQILQLPIALVLPELNPASWVAW